MYSIFNDFEDEKDQYADSSNLESFIDETPLEKIEIISGTNEESEMATSQFSVSEKDPLGIAGNLNASTIENTSHTNNTNQSHVAMKFDLPEHSSIIKVIGVGGGGSNAVNHMYRQGIKGVDFIVCNTDKQALDMSPVPHKIVLGTTLTEGRGAGSLPEVGRNAAIENIEDIRSVLANNTKMVFITAGMGGGTGTGAAPIIAGIAREMGILTVAIVTVPFLFEGKKRRQQAEDGLEQLKQNVDTLLVVCNDKLREMYGNLKLSDAFSHADDVLAIAAKSIAEVISLTQQINVDFADVCTVMRNSGVAIMGSAAVSGENRSTRAVEMALNSPLLNDNNITGARYVLLNIISGENEITMDELGEITDYIQEAAGQTAEIIKGYGVDPSLGDSVNVTIIATGFNQNNPIAYEYTKKQAEEKVVLKLEENKTETVAELVKEETKAETVNPLEPFLVSKQPEPIAEVKTIEAEITNPLEPFLITKVEEPVAEIVAAPIAEVTLEEEILAPIAEVTLEEEILAPIADVTLTEETFTPVAELLELAEFVSPVSETETVTDEVVEPVLNTNVVFEITNYSSSENSDLNENSNLELIAEEEIYSEPIAETWSEPVAEMTVEPVAEINLVSEPVAEVTYVNEPVAEETNYNEPYLIKKSEPVAEVSAETVLADKLNQEELEKRIQTEELQKKAQERIMKLKALSLKLKTPKGLNEMEHEPAYKRRNVSLENVPHSSESQVSRYTLTENEEKKIEIRPNNSFLHDNVD
ncbi:MAG: cell division protein FtsZ [Bacteroidetes bacterium]|nr:cell division protein FtsZ [Bacteroidota bacterium]